MVKAELLRACLWQIPLTREFVGRSKHLQGAGHIEQLHAGKGEHMDRLGSVIHDLA